MFSRIVAHNNPNSPAYKKFHRIFVSQQCANNYPILCVMFDEWLRCGTSLQCLKRAKQRKCEDKPGATIIWAKGYNFQLRYYTHESNLENKWTGTILRYRMKIESVCLRSPDVALQTWRWKHVRARVLFHGHNGDTLKFYLNFKKNWSLVKKKNLKSGIIVWEKKELKEVLKHSLSLEKLSSDSVNWYGVTIKSFNHR